MNVQDNFQSFCDQVANIGPYDRITFTDKDFPTVITLQRNSKRWQIDAAQTAVCLVAYFCKAIKTSDDRVLPSLKTLTNISKHYSDVENFEASTIIDRVIKKIEEKQLLPVRKSVQTNHQPSAKRAKITCSDGTIWVPVDVLKKIADHQLTDFSKYPKDAIAKTVSLLLSSEKPSSLFDLLWIYSIAHDLEIDRCLKESGQEIDTILLKNHNAFAEALIFYYKEIMTYDNFEECPLNIAFVQKLYPKEIDWQNVCPYHIKELRAVLMLASQRNIPSAIFYLGKFSLEGIGCNKDGPLAIQYFEKARELGDVSALFTLGFCYFMGDAVERCLDKAEMLFSLAVVNNYLPALYSLGLLYQNEEKLNFDLAFKLFKAASERHYLPAYAELGLCYYNGMGVEEDEGLGIDWLLHASNKGFTPAKYYLGKIFKAEMPFEAFFLFKEAADKGFGLACKEVAEMYEEGKVVEKNPKLAKEYFQKGELDLL